MTKQEKEMIKAIASKRKVDKEMEIFEQMLPAIRAIMKNGGDANSILKKSGPLAAYKTVELLGSEKEEVALKAADKILAYDLGKPVEKSINVYGDISRMNEKDVDNQILQLLKDVGPRKLLANTLDIKVSKPKQKRKPRTEKVLEAEIISERTEPTKPA